MKQMTDSDYVEFYARKIKEDSSLFDHQKKFLNSQLKASSSLFKKRFGKNFKKEARKYLKGVGLL